MKIIELLLAEMATNGIYPKNNKTGFKVSAGEIQLFTIESYPPDGPMGWYIFSRDYSLCVYGVEGKKQCFAYIHEPMQLNYAEEEIQRFVDNEQRSEEERYRRTKKYKSRVKRFNFQQDWNKSVPINNQHRILRKNSINSCGLQEFNDELIAPICNGQKEIVGLQYFLLSGDSFYRAYPLPSDARSYICDKKPDTNTKIALCVDYLTGTKIYEETGHYTVVCYDQQNLIQVAADIRSEYPNHSLYICPNHSSECIALAENAAVQNSGKLIIPKELKSRADTSFYDLIRVYKKGAIKVWFQEAMFSEGTYYAN